MIEITVPIEFVERGIESMEDEIERIEEVEKCFEENDLTHLNSYTKLQGEREDLEIGVSEMETRLEGGKHSGLVELFGEE